MKGCIAPNQQGLCTLLTWFTDLSGFPKIAHLILVKWTLWVNIWGQSPVPAPLPETPPVATRVSSQLFVMLLYSIWNPCLEDLPLASLYLSPNNGWYSHGVMAICRYRFPRRRMCFFHASAVSAVSRVSCCHPSTHEYSSTVVLIPKYLVVVDIHPSLNIIIPGMRQANMEDHGIIQTIL